MGQCKLGVVSFVVKVVSLSMEQVQFFLSSLALPKNIAGDFSLLLLFAGMSVGLGFVFGRFKLVNILINVYIALAFVGIIPRELLSFSVYGHAIVFVALLVLLTAVDKRLFDLHISNAGTDFFWRLIVTSMLVTGLVMSATLSLLPKSIALGFISVAAYGYFASQTAIVFWMVVPLLVLLFINNRLK
jgi:hypothetical protein